jgi:hypothetical protein
MGGLDRLVNRGLGGQRNELQDNNNWKDINIKTLKFLINIINK